MSYLHGAGEQGHCMGDIKGRTERRELTPCIIYADMSCHHSPAHHKKGGRERGNLGFESVETGKKGRTGGERRPRASQYSVDETLHSSLKYK